MRPQHWHNNLAQCLFLLLSLKICFDASTRFRTFEANDFCLSLKEALPYTTNFIHNSTCSGCKELYIGELCAPVFVYTNNTSINSSAEKLNLMNILIIVATGNI